MRPAGFDLICCPVCRGELSPRGGGASRCASCAAEYGAVAGIPNLVVGGGAFDEPRPGLGLLHRIVAHPAIYNAVQRAAGREKIRARVAPAFARTEGATVLDVGAGTASFAGLLAPDARYVWLDSDPQKLKGVTVDGEAVLGNALQMGIRAQAVDLAVCVAVSHHLDDETVPQLFAELARVARRLLFLEPVTASAAIGRALWRLDRGAYPRSLTALRELLLEHFEVEHEEHFAVLHEYLFVCARTKDGA
jgi:SAM-dependent methyltransferase/uncharacterized protein YbaR (Trm112 family)